MPNEPLNTLIPNAPPAEAVRHGVRKKAAIIAHSDAASDWQPSGKALITESEELFDLLGLDPADLPAALAASADFPLKVPRSYVERIERGNPQDPLLLQILGQGIELQPVAGFAADPLDEQSFAPVPGILHKYHGRVLLMATGACAIHCRYCFRRHFPYQEHVSTTERLAGAIAWLEQRDDITEVILSGGDPLSLSDRRLRDLLARLAALPQLRRLRIHTRLPLVMPERVSEGLLQVLTDFPLPVAMVLHANNANELSDDVMAAFSLLRARGVTLLNQTVLLKGVNADVGALCDLSERLYEAAVLPYYLHQLDPVAGAAHFMVDDAQALALHGAMQERLPGYLVPRLVREMPAEKSKTWLSGRSIGPSG